MAAVHRVVTAIHRIPPPGLHRSPHHAACTRRAKGLHKKRALIRPPGKMCLEISLSGPISSPTLGDQARWPPSGGGPRRLSSACPGGQSPSSKGCRLAFAHPCRRGWPTTHQVGRFSRGRPGSPEELRPRPARPRRAPSPLSAVCARGWLGGVYMEAQKGWSLTSAHSAAMRSFLQK